MKKISKELFLIFICITSIFTLEAKTARLNTSLQYGDTASLWVDTFLPPVLNEDTSVFIDFQQQYNGWTSGGDLAYVLSPGIGMRKKYGSQVFGAYLFADYMQSYHGKKFWGGGPGFDFYKGAFQLALNTYLPFGRQEHKIGTNELVTITTKSPAPHEALETTLRTKEIKKERLPFGLDLTGYYIPESKPYFAEAGFYYYNANHIKPITGGRIALGYFPLPNLKLKIQEEYDNRSRNRVVGSIEISLGGVFNGNLKSKLIYPIYRRQNLNTTKKGSTSEIFLFTSKSSQNNIQLFDNIWYVNGGSSTTLTTLTQGNVSATPAAGDIGSFENPFPSLALALAPNSGAPSDANFWLTGDDTSLANATATLTGTQTLSGRTANFQAQASILPLTEMPQITTRMIITSDNQVKDLQLFAEGEFASQRSPLRYDPTLLIKKGSPGSVAQLSDVNIKRSKSTPVATFYCEACVLDTDAVAFLNRCNLEATCNSISGSGNFEHDSICISAYEGSSLNLKASSLSAKQGGAGNGSPVGIYVTDSTLETNSVTLRAETTNISNNSYVFGIYAVPETGIGNTINLTDTSIFASGEFQSLGLYHFQTALNPSTSSINLKNCSLYSTSTTDDCLSLSTNRLSTLTIDNCSLTHVYTGTDANSLANARVSGSTPSQVNISNTSIHGEARSGGRAWGLQASSSLVNLNLSNSEVTSISSGGSSVAIYSAGILDISDTVISTQAENSYALGLWGAGELTANRILITSTNSQGNAFGIYSNSFTPIIANNVDAYAVSSYQQTTGPYSGNSYAVFLFGTDAKFEGTSSQRGTVVSKSNLTAFGFFLFNSQLELSNYDVTAINFVNPTGRVSINPFGFGAMVSNTNNTFDPPYP